MHLGISFTTTLYFFIFVATCLTQDQDRNSVLTSGMEKKNQEMPSSDHSGGGRRARGLASEDRFVKLITRADTSTGSSSGNSSTGNSIGTLSSGNNEVEPNLNGPSDPKVCATIVKNMKEAEALTKAAGSPAAKRPSTVPSSSPKSSSGSSRRSKLAQIHEFDLNRRADPPASSTGSQTNVDPNSCKEMQAMVQAQGEKLAASLKKMTSGDVTSKKDNPSTDSKTSNPK
ncbi:uncharacterized protein MELLADRAFT_66895 [Melampsora larici-populina 98AG31]|uniref:Secreted protein n=1 Tax=Melampsora larici-populina (strain 98AG31 / pathotype 3-4-7) TaxID=747676 RepID=F4S111_MELLP|nr:uncharacterized protein MELLADRAFT_66895 [Melampsora larici-populina 98AG31]EGG01688.1 secreted protein [Melampsora larici-populina 98AG31]